MKKIITSLFILLAYLPIYAENASVTVTVDSEKSLFMALEEAGLIDSVDVNAEWGGVPYYVICGKRIDTLTIKGPLTLDDCTQFITYWGGNNTNTTHLKHVVLNEASFPNNTIPTGTFGLMGEFDTRGIAGLISVELPSSVVAIASGAFAVSEYAFEQTLTTINWSDLVNLQKIEGRAFYNISSLEDVVVPATVTFFGTLNSSGFLISSETSGISFISPFSKKQSYLIDSGSSLQVDNGGLYMSFSYNGAMLKALVLFMPQAGQTELVVAAGTHAIASGTFTDTNITKLTLPSDFGGTYNTTCFTLPAGLFEITNTFSDTSTIEEVVLPEGIYFIPANMFRNSSLQRINFPNSLVIIENNAFEATRLSGTLEFPTSLKKIESGAFQSVAGIESIVFAAGCSLTKLAQGSFGYCGNLKGVVDLSSMTELTSLGAIPYNQYAGVFEGTGVTEVKLPSNLETIGEYTFKNSKLEGSIIFPSSLKVIGFEAFAGCSVNIQSNSSNFITQNGILYGYVKDPSAPAADSIIAPIAILPSFDPNEILQLNEYVTFIPERFFAGSTLKGLRTASGLTKIASGAFEGCTSLEMVDLSNSGNLALVQYNAFYGCSALTSVSYPENGDLLLERGSFANCAMTSVVLPIGLRVYDEWGQLAFTYEVFQNTPIKRFTLSGSNLYGLYADKGVLFDQRNGILLAYPAAKTNTRYTTPTGLDFIITEVAYGAFEGATNLRRINYSDGVVTARGFTYTSNEIEELYFAPSVQSIEGFSACENLKTVTCLSTVMPYSSGTFYWDIASKDATLYVPASLLADYQALDGTDWNYDWHKFSTILAYSAAELPEDDEEEVSALQGSTIGETLVYVIAGKLYVQGAENMRSMTIYNAMGQHVITTTSNGVALDKGIYVVQVKLENGHAVVDKAIVR